MQFADINGTVIHHQMIGGPAGKPVLVFINSLGTDFRIWRDVIVGLAGDVPILAYDKRGHGLSGDMARPGRMADHIDDLEGLLSHLGIRSAILCGVSVGGQIAIGLAARRPELVAGLVLCDTAHKLGSVESWNARIGAVENNGIAAIAAMVLERWFTPGFIKTRAAEFHGYGLMLKRTTPGGYVATCEAIRDTDLTDAARHIRVPTLCLVGAQDGSTPPDLVRSLSGLIAESRFEVIADAGHLPCIEQPQVMVGLVRDHLSLMAATNPVGRTH